MKKHLQLIVLLLIPNFIWSQGPQKHNAVEIFEQVQELNFLGKVLYVAAHPDDENTKLITYFSNQYHAQTAYLSLTRGDGGQNLIGTELREKLGAIRTQELLAARRIDGGEQFFTRANDFGFSKEPNETYAIWNKQEVLDDVIQVLTTFQPDIVIHRFAHNTPGTTHGHHTASAQLSLEAIQTLKKQPKRVFFNTSWWFYGSQEAFEAADKSTLMALSTNVFYPLKGKSNNEIAALSRSQHKCQGFGTLGTRGEEIEYLDLLKGDMPKTNNLFEGIDTSWNRVQGGQAIGAILNEVEKNFNFNNPSLHLPNLIKAYQLIEQLDDAHWKAIKSKQLLKIIEACSGLFMEAVADTESTTPSTDFNLTLEVINRSASKAKLVAVKVLELPTEVKNIELKNNIKNSLSIKNIRCNGTTYSNLFWLDEPKSEGMYRISQPDLRILPEVTTAFPVVFTLEIEGNTIEIVKNICYKFNSPDDGETYVPFTLLPEATTAITPEVLLFNGAQSKTVTVSVTAHKAGFKGIISLCYPSDWKVEPKEISIEISSKNESKNVTFTVYPSKDSQATSTLMALVQVADQVLDRKLITLQYPHIPKQTLLVPSSAKAVRLDLKIKGKNIGYIMGAGDEIPHHLAQVGYQVTLLQPDAITPEKIKNFDAVILGIRAFNVVEELKYKNKILFEYVKNGGNLIVQYNTSNNLVTKEIAPYQLKISNDRVTNENATITFLQPQHNVLHYPNTITQNDFTGWVQEQGLYYPSQWGSEFTPILASNDEGETPKNGGLLLAKYGKGNYVYTGLSFFRELPEGVSGAYRLLANLIALEH